MGPVLDDAASGEFHAFFERHYAELSRLAHLLTGEVDAADDLAADALLALWHRWDRVRAADHPVAYARGVVANLARTRIRSAVRERRRIALFWSQREEKTENPDVAGVVDVQEALRGLPFRKRACVVLRHAFDLSEKDTALALGISVGTVKSQTSKAMAELQRSLGTRAAPRKARAVPAGGGSPAGTPTTAAAGTPAGDGARPPPRPAPGSCPWVAPSPPGTTATAGGDRRPTPRRADSASPVEPPARHSRPKPAPRATTGHDLAQELFMAGQENPMRALPNRLGHTFGL